jgi:alkanesulfonate monooxygenase SsuD/methylene tetrahydromethanopterin reductase-like flavin-dependent oxidoreductase (luciferase family)
LEETIVAVRSLLQGELYNARGKYVSLENVQLEYPPIQAPPISAGVRGLRSLRLAGRVADGTVLAEGAAPAYVSWAKAQIVIGADGEQTLRVVARYADIWDCSVATAEEYSHKSTILDSICMAVGRNPATIERSRRISVDPSDLHVAYQETRAFIELGATHIIYHVPVPDPSSILSRLAEEVALPLRTEYQGSKPPSIR